MKNQNRRLRSATTTRENRMKTIATIKIQENDKYQKRLCREDIDETLGLYAVMLPHMPPWYVLADSEVGAKSQATCAKNYPRGEDGEPMRCASCVRLPLLIRGWSGSEF